LVQINLKFSLMEQSEMVVINLVGQGNTKCPMCGSKVIRNFRPFCSRRCANSDLSKWLNGSYKVPLNKLEDDDLEELETLEQKELNSSE